MGLSSGSRCASGVGASGGLQATVGAVGGCRLSWAADCSASMRGCVGRLALADHSAPGDWLPDAGAPGFAVQRRSRSSGGQIFGRNLFDFRPGPLVLSIFKFGPDLFDHIRRDRGSIISPVGSHISQDRCQLLNPCIGPPRLASRC